MNSIFGSLSGRARRMVLLVIIYIGFVSLGLPDTILGVAWNSMRLELELPVYYAGVMALLLTACSAVSAFCSGAILRRVGTGRVLMICGFITGTALLGYALSPSFWLLLLFTVPLGFGQGAVDTGMNYYVARHYSSRDMSWLHCCWGIGASVGPGLVTLILATGSSWRWGYGTVSAIQLTLACVFLVTLGLWREDGDNADAKKVTPAQAPSGKVNYSGRFWCCPAMFFLYCGAEFSMGLWGYMFLTECRGMSGEAAGFAVSGYWGMLCFGRFLIGVFANRLGNIRQIRYSMIGAVAGGILLAVPGSAVLAVVALGLIGFAFAPFYPAMMHAAPERFDDATSCTVIGYQGGAGMIGAAAIPMVIGYVASFFSFAFLPYMPVIFGALVLLLQSIVDGRCEKANS